MDVTESGIRGWQEVPWGSDFCHFYDSRGELLDASREFVAAGLANGEACLWLTSEPLSRDDARSALASTVADLSAHEERGQLQIVELEEWYHRTGPIDAVEGWRKCGAAATASGFAGWRLCCNLVEHVPAEMPLAGSFSGSRMVALFSYSLSACSAAQVLEAASSHSITLVRNDGAGADGPATGQHLTLRAAADVASDRDLRDAERMKNEFLGVVGHELRNPLASILTASQLMALRGGDQQFRKEIEIVQRQVSNITGLLDELLDMARLVSGRIELERVRVEIGDAINRGIEIATPLVAKRAHRLHVRFPESGLAVDGDPQRLAQIVAHLLKNAARFTEPGGDITVAAARDDGAVTFSVEDTGRGIEPERLPALFEPFRQTREARRRAGGGLGLGLPLVRGLVELHGGSIDVASTPSRGSRFVVRLPSLDADAERR